LSLIVPHYYGQFWGQCFHFISTLPHQTRQSIARPLPLTRDREEYELARALTGREEFPTVTPPELYIGAGRRSGKTRFSALLAVHAAAQRYKLPPGGYAVAAIVAPDRKQASVAFDYARGLVIRSKVLKASLERETNDSMEFKHSTKLEVLTGNFRAVHSLALAVVDEAAFPMDSEGRNSDEELARALRPALAT
jgi:hypothetical protein